MKITLSIIIVSYNTCDMTLNCLESVFEHTSDITYEIILIDNMSEDGSYDKIKEKYSGKIQLIQSGMNLGFARANNLASKKAKGEFILLLNPDTLLFENAIKELVEFASDNLEAKIWGGKTFFIDHSLNKSNCWNKQTVRGLIFQAFGLNSLFRNNTFFNPEGIGGWSRNSVKNVDIVSGCFFLIKTIFWREMDGFKSKYFMYGEEADLCLRAREYDARPLINPNAQIVHFGGASEKVRVDKLVRLLKAKMMLINDHFPEHSKAIGKSLLVLWPLSRAISFFILNFFKDSDLVGSNDWKEVWKNRKEWISQ